MINKIKYLFGFSHTRPVFLIGTGRSGTHWLGYSLGDHPEVSTTIEVEPMFSLSTRMALNPELEKELFHPLVVAYKRRLLESAPRLYLDKTHPNIWIADKLKKAFPKSLFIGIERNPYATVASMMNHIGVSAWHKRWREFPLPNRFLGITEELEGAYESIPFASKCAMRWVSHHARMNELRSILGNDLLVISYESFAHNPEKIMHDLQQFLRLDSFIPAPDVKTDSLDKWKKQLSNNEIKQIEIIVGFPTDSINQ